MAKIKYYKLKGLLPKGRKIKSIVGEVYLNNYEERLQEHTKAVHQNHRARLKAEEIVLHDNIKEDD